MCCLGVKSVQGLHGTVANNAISRKIIAKPCLTNDNRSSIQKRYLELSMYMSSQLSTADKSRMLGYYSFSILLRQNTLVRNPFKIPIIDSNRCLNIIFMYKCDSYLLSSYNFHHYLYRYYVMCGIARVA